MTHHLPTWNDVQQAHLMEAVPEYYHEAQALYPGLLPPKTEQLDDVWRNRTTAENAAWLIELLAKRLTEERSDIQQLNIMAEGAASGAAWDGNERRRQERRGTQFDRRQRDYNPRWEGLPDA